MCGNNHWIRCNNPHPAITICLCSYLNTDIFLVQLITTEKSAKLHPITIIYYHNTTDHMHVHTHTHTTHHTHSAHISRGHCLPQLSQKPASMNSATSRTGVSAASCTNQTSPCQLTYAAKDRRASWGTLKWHIFQSCRSAADGCRSTQDAGLLHPSTLVRVAPTGCEWQNWPCTVWCWLLEALLLMVIDRIAASR